MTDIPNPYPPDDETANSLFTIQSTVKDLVADFLYYDRKEDDTLPVGRIEELIEAGPLSAGMLVEWFGIELRAALDAS